jgi:hypothetical protein
VPTTEREAVAWLAQQFGKDAADAASVVLAEQRSTDIICEHERSRESERVPQRDHQQERSPSRAHQQGHDGFSR